MTFKNPLYVCKLLPECHQKNNPEYVLPFQKTWTWPLCLSCFLWTTFDLDYYPAEHPNNFTKWFRPLDFSKKRPGVWTRLYTDF